MHSYNIADARKRFPEIVAAAEHGIETIIMRNGTPVAKVVMLTAPRFEIGAFDGLVQVSDDFDSSIPEEFKDHL